VQPLHDLGQRAHAPVIRVEAGALDDAGAFGGTQRGRRVASFGVVVGGVRVLPAVAAPYGSYAAFGFGRSADVIADAVGGGGVAIATSRGIIPPPSAVAKAASLAPSSAGLARNASAVALAEKRSLSVDSAAACSTLKPSTRAASRTALRPR
jgi:hypothetical protein